jgi:hypothetical protein
MLRFFQPSFARWITAIALSFSVAMLAFSVGGMGARHAAADAEGKVTVTARADGSGGSSCDACGGDHQMATTACSAVCASSVAIVAPAALPLITGPLGMPALALTRWLVGHSDPPDPYPPKAVVLS